VGLVVQSGNQVEFRSSALVSSVDDLSMVPSCESSPTPPPRPPDQPALPRLQSPLDAPHESL